jgi:hypothetical protein
VNGENTHVFDRFSIGTGTLENLKERACFSFSKDVNWIEIHE